MLNVENDTTEFKITLVDKPLTRRCILATVSSIYDPLGLVESLLLPGRDTFSRKFVVRERLG